MDGTVGGEILCDLTGVDNDGTLHWVQKQRRRRSPGRRSCRSSWQASSRPRIGARFNSMERDTGSNPDTRSKDRVWRNRARFPRRRRQPSVTRGATANLAPLSCGRNATLPKAQALLETSAEVLQGLVPAFGHYEIGKEAAFRRWPPASIDGGSC